MTLEYPNIDPKTLTPLRILQQVLKDNPTALEGENCPYGAELRAFLRIFTPKTPGSGAFLGKNGSKWAILEQESLDLYTELKNFGVSLKDGDSKEKMGYFRTATALLEKIIAINERAVGLKHIHEFQETTMGVMDEVLTPDQRTAVMGKLRAAIDGNDPVVAPKLETIKDEE